jgi:hypothetical protein
MWVEEAEAVEKAKATMGVDGARGGGTRGRRNGSTSGRDGRGEVEGGGSGDADEA